MKKKTLQKKFKNLPNSKNTKKIEIQASDKTVTKKAKFEVKILIKKEKTNVRAVFLNKKTLSQFLFPNNKRFITELKSASFWAFLISFIGIILTIFIGYNLFKDIKINREKQKLLKTELHQDQIQIIEYPDIKYLYLKASILAFELKDLNQAKIFIQKAIKLDPNDKQILQDKANMNL